MGAHDHSCSREHSRQARKIIAKSVYPYLGKDPALAIPPQCPLHPALDMFKDQEEHKRLVPGERDIYQCGYCQKQFKTEFYMDRHMDNKHPDRLILDREIDAEAYAYADADADVDADSTPPPGRCLGDLCPVLGCGEYDIGDCRVEIRSGDGDEGIVRRGCGMCDPADMERRRRECVAVFDRCMAVSDGDPTAYRGERGLEAGHFEDLRYHFVRQFCDHLACDSHHRPLVPPVEGEGERRRHPIPGSVGDSRGGIGMPKALLMAVLVPLSTFAETHFASMGPSTWPDPELAPLEERPLLEAASLRRFGVNYLQDAVCTGLGLVAHLDGSHVRLLAYSSRLGWGERPDGASGGIVADIDLEAGWRSQNLDNKRRDAARSLRGEAEGGPGLATAFRGPARGLSWGRCTFTPRPAAAESGGSSLVSGPHGGAGGGAGVGVIDGNRREQGGEEVACHIAVACGAEVLLWKVSRVLCDVRTGGSAEEREVGHNQEVRYRYSTVSVRTDWRRGSRDNNSSTDREEAAIPSGSIRCLSFRPCGGGSAGLSAVSGGAGRDENLPLTAWYDAGAAVLGCGGCPALLPAPVMRERACGAWSGCGRRLAVSSGGEIRVYSDPSEEHPLKMATALASSAVHQRPVKAGAVRECYDPTSSHGKHAVEVMPLATEVRAGWLSAEEESRRGVAGSENTFRTALCVEATMYEGGILSPPGSSPGGGMPSSLPPSSRQAATALPPRSSAAFGGRGGLGPTSTAAASGAPAESGVPADGHGASERSCSRTTPPPPALASMEGLMSPALIGDMRAMCPAGPLAFFGATDGGLGLDSVLAATGSTDAGGLSSAGNGPGSCVTERVGSDLLGAIVNTSNASRTAAAALEAVDAEKPSRRGGFRHVLPGENWLAGSLRPSSRSASPSRRQRGSGSPESPRDSSDRESPKPSECALVVPLAGREAADLRAAVVGSVVEASRPTVASQVLDLRGKLGGGGDSGGAGGASVTSTHPLFRLSLPGGVGAINSSVIGSSGSDRGSTPNTGKAAAAPVRRPWLVRVSCRSRSSGGTADARSSGTGSVGVKALASLPPGLSSPDLLASSDDGRHVAVGSHACELVACFRLELRSTDECSVGAEGEEVKSSSNPAGEGSLPSSTNGGPLAGGGSGGRAGGKADKGAVRQKKRRHRRAVPLCTLRLPPGYRAKGLAVVKEKRGPSGRCGTRGTAAQASNTGGTAWIPSSGDSVADEVVVLVLGGCAVTDACAATGAVRRSSTGGPLLSAEPGRCDSSSNTTSGEELYHTVLLRYMLPPASSETSGDKAVRGGERASDGGDRTNVSTSTLAPDGSKDKCPASSCDEQRGREASGVSTGPVAHGSTPLLRANSMAEHDVRTEGGARLEAIVLQAVAGAEQRMDDRFDRIERMLVGVCDRLGVLEDIVKGQRPR
eukprot:g7654.t1